MYATITQPNTATTPEKTGGFGDPNSIVDYLKGTGQGSTMADRSKLYTSTFGANSGKYTGSNAQNMALLTKVKGGYSGTTDPTKISGSSSVGQNMQVAGALGKAGGTLAPTAPPAPAPATPTDPNAPAAPTSVLDTSINQVKDNAATQLKEIEVPFTSNYSALQETMKQAVEAAKQEYERAGGIVSSTGEQEYVGNVQKHYQTQLDNMQNEYNVQKQGILSAQETSIQNLKATYQANQATTFKDYLAGLKQGDGTQPSSDELMDAIQTAISAGKSPQQAISEIKGALSYAKRVEDKNDAQIRHMNIMEAHAMANEQIALGRLSREDRNSAVSNINTAVDNFTKAGTPGQQLNNASSYMSSIEAAHKNGGAGVSALTLIDALVKLDTGGQAIREGQTNILKKSGTYSDALNRQLAKFEKDNGKIGANTTLSKNQVDQIYNIAKDIAAEKVNSGVQQYSDLLRGVNETKAAYPGTEGIVDATANLGNISTFINQYSSDYHYDDVSGHLYQKVGGNWVAK